MSHTDQTTKPVQIQTDIARLEILLTDAKASGKETKSFLAEKLHHGEITTQELIDALLYFSLLQADQNMIVDH